MINYCKFLPVKRINNIGFPVFFHILKDILCIKNAVSHGKTALKVNQKKVN
jgi:hypothetical protein